MTAHRTDVRFETTGQWFDEFIGVPTNPGLKPEPMFKRILLSIWPVIKRLEKFGMKPKEITEEYDVTEEEVRAAHAYYQAFPWRVDLRMDDDGW